MISISSEELIKYHNEVYIQLNHKRQYFPFDPTSKLSQLRVLALDSPNFSPVDSKNTFAINELIVDAEIYDNLDGTIDSALDDQNVLEFVHSQKLHKLNFLEEIKLKGIRLKQDKESIDRNKTMTMNY
jgi:hypothetical protein